MRYPHPGRTSQRTKALKFAITAGSASSVLEGKLEVGEAVHAAPSTAIGWHTLLEQPLTWVLAGIAAVLGFVVALAFRPANRASRAPLVLASRRFLLSMPTGPAPTKVTIMPMMRRTAVALAQTDAPRRLADGDVFLPKSSQRLLHVRTLVAKREASQQGRELIGTVVPDPSTFGQVQAPMDGRIELPERGISHVGQHVEAGEVLALLSPSIPIADLGTMQQLTAEVVGKLRIAEQKLVAPHSHRRRRRAEGHRRYPRRARGVARTAASA